MAAVADGAIIRHGPTQTRLATRPTRLLDCLGIATAGKLTGVLAQIPHRHQDGLARKPSLPVPNRAARIDRKSVV